MADVLQEGAGNHKITWRWSAGRFAVAHIDPPLIASNCSFSEANELAFRAGQRKIILSLTFSAVSSLEEAGDGLFTFLQFPKLQWKALRTTNALERINGEFRRRTKTQASLPGEDAVLLLLYGLLRSGQIVLRRIDGRQDMPKAKTQLKRPNTTVLQIRQDCRVLPIKGLFSWCFDLSASGFAFASRRRICRKIKGLRLCNTVVLRGRNRE
jgi:hypothetical protein